MRNLVASVLGVVAIVFGGSILLFLLPWAAIQDPKLNGSWYWFAVLDKLGLTARGILIGLGLVFCGVLLNLYVTFPSASDFQAKAPARLVLFWGLAGLGTMLFGLLFIGITFLVL